MNSAIFHIHGRGMIGAAVIDLDADRVIAESPNLRFAHEWTLGQLRAYMRGHYDQQESTDLLEGRWRPEQEPDERPVVRKPLVPGGCWGRRQIPARRGTNTQAHDEQCGQRARKDHLTCGWHVHLENAARELCGLPPK